MRQAMLRKKISAATLALCVLLFAACGAPGDGLTMQTKRSVYPVGTTEVTATWRQNGSTEYFFGEPYALQQWDGAAWQPMQPTDEMSFILPAYVLRDGESRDITYRVGAHYDPLAAGRYRIAAGYFSGLGETHKEFQVYAEFTVG